MRGRGASGPPRLVESAMWVTLALVAALGEAAAPSWSAGERMPVVAAVLTPADQGTTTFSVTAVLGVLADVLDEGGLFRLAPLDPSVERCAGRPSCVVDVVRASVDDSDERRPRLLLVISLRGDGYVVPITYDWPRALAVVAAGGDPDVLDAALFDRAVLRRPGATEATTVERLRAGLAAAVADLEVAAQDVPGQLELEVDRHTATALVLGPDAEWWVAPTVGLAVGLLGYGVAEATQSRR